MGAWFSFAAAQLNNSISALDTVGEFRENRRQEKDMYVGYMLNFVFNDSNLPIPATI